MLFGVCTGYKNAEFVKKCGYDFLEMSLNEVSAMSDEEFEICVKSLKEADIKALAFNCFFPGDIKLVGPDMNLNVISDYTKKAIKRASVLGAEIVVLGSGGSRKIEESYNTLLCEEQFVKVLVEIGKIAQNYGITLVVEPLNQNETNLINTVPDAADFANRSASENVKALVDFFHFEIENEPDGDIINYKNELFHVHVANADRKAPTEQNIEDLKKWSELLKKINYSNKISIEARYDDFESEIETARKLLEIFVG